MFRLQNAIWKGDSFSIINLNPAEQYEKQNVSVKYKKKEYRW